MAAGELTVRQVMQPEPVTVPPDCPMREVMRVMNRHRIGAILVVRGGSDLVGIFTERDLVRRVIGAIPGWRDYPVSDWMTPNPHTIGPDVGWDEAVGRMTKLRVRHLPVLEHGKLAGVISSRALMARRAEHLNARVDERTRDLRQLNDELLARDAEVSHYLRAAGQLQKNLMLPHAPPEWAELTWGIHYSPLDHLGGDYYDFAEPAPDHLGVFIADASGHGVPAAMVAIMTRLAFAEAAARSVHPGEVLTAMNAQLVGLTEERFVTAFYGVLDRRSGVLRYASAGHPYPYLVDGRSGQVQPLSNQGFLLGVMPGEVYGERRVEVRPGDRLAFYTDGVIEARNEIGELFGSDRLTGCLRTHGRGTPAAIVEEVLCCQKGFCRDTPMTDDCTLVVVGVS